MASGCFLDACDIYLAGGVLGSLVASGWSTLNANALFMSATFLGMLVGTLSAGYLGDRYGRRFSYQLNLLIFGLASIAASFSPNMDVLIGARFIMGIGMGAEIIVGYASLAEFMPRARRGFYVAMLSVITNCAVPFVGAGRCVADPDARLAGAVRDHRRVCAGGVVHAQDHAGKPPLAGKQGPAGRSRGADGDHRGGCGPARPPAPGARGVSRAGCGWFVS